MLNSVWLHLFFILMFYDPNPYHIKAKPFLLYFDISFPSLKFVTKRKLLKKYPIYWIFCLSLFFFMAF